MEEILLHAKSSSGEPYQVVFTIDGDLARVECSCPAGEWGKLCKHKTQLLHGDGSMLFRAEEQSALRKVESYVKDSEIGRAMKDYLTSKKEMDAAKRREAKLRKKLESVLRGDSR